MVRTLKGSFARLRAAHFDIRPADRVWARQQATLIGGPTRAATRRDIDTWFTAMTGKDKTMEWKQIETKWAAMARRIRADAQCGIVDDSVVILRRVSKAEVARNAGVSQIAGTGNTAPQKRDPVSTH